MGTSNPTGVSIVLGSRSPRRRELLEQLVGADAVRVVPPEDETEQRFDDVASLTDVDVRLLEIARGKHADVCRQIRNDEPAPVVLTADTVIIGFDADGRPVALEKPPEAEDAYRETVREWFEKFYAGKSHLAKTGVVAGYPSGLQRELVVTTEVWFRADAVEWIDWYLQTGEPRGKAGGYAIQGAGSLFVEQIAGSLSNVVGLPLAETSGLLRSLGANVS
ncbi:MAG: Maf-like protein [Planctomycetaceae bacterium]|nr:Maf-like protein [Planctomycetaceae bacterium]